MTTTSAGRRSGTAAEILVANVGAKRPIRRATLFAVKDARVAVSDRGHARQIEPQNSTFRHARRGNAQACQSWFIQKAVIVAVPATPALTQRTSRLRHACRETSRIRQRGRDGLHPRLRRSHLAQCSDQVFAQAPHTLGRNRYQGFVVAGHDDRLAVLVGIDIAADFHRSKVRHAVEFNVNGASSTA